MTRGTLDSPKQWNQKSDSSVKQEINKMRAVKYQYSKLTDQEGSGRRSVGGARWFPPTLWTYCQIIFLTGNSTSGSPSWNLGLACRANWKNGSYMMWISHNIWLCVAGAIFGEIGCEFCCSDDKAAVKFWPGKAIISVANEMTKSRGNLDSVLCLWFQCGLLHRFCSCSFQKSHWCMQQWKPEHVWVKFNFVAPESKSLQCAGSIGHFLKLRNLLKWMNFWVSLWWWSGALAE